MNAFRHRRSRRAFCWLALAAWLFALSAGVASACRLEGLGGLGHAPWTLPDGAHRSHAPEGRDKPTQDCTGHDAPGGAAQSCLKVCDEISHSAGSRAFAADDVGTVPHPAVAPTRHGAMPAHAARRGSFSAESLPPEPPPRVLYSRMAD
jgi:hypothetical protein